MTYFSQRATTVRTSFRAAVPAPSAGAGPYDRTATESGSGRQRHAALPTPVHAPGRAA